MTVVNIIWGCTLLYKMPEYICEEYKSQKKKQVNRVSKSITMWGVDPQINWDGRDAFVGACYPVSFSLNFRPYFFEVHKLLSLAV